MEFEIVYAIKNRIENISSIKVLLLGIFYGTAFTSSGS